MRCASGSTRSRVISTNANFRGPPPHTLRNDTSSKYREEGLHPTAEAARCRLRALGSMDPLDATANPTLAKEAQEALKASKADLKSWTVRYF